MGGGRRAETGGQPAASRMAVRVGGSRYRSTRAEPLVLIPLTNAATVPEGMPTRANGVRGSPTSALASSILP